jgi:hypothetical protein
MQRFTELAAAQGEQAALAEAAAEMTARPTRDQAPHEQVQRNAERDAEPA